MKIFFKRLLIVLGLFPVAFGLFLLYSTVFNYRPGKEIVLLQQDSYETLSDTVKYRAMIWNIGYSGLGANMDFFYDGGSQVRDTKENVMTNFRHISEFIKGNDSLDFILLQEVDIRSKRSYRLNELKELSALLSEHNSYAGVNYKVDFVPVPVRSPLGKVYSGVVTFSREKPKNVIRCSFEGNYSWPTSLFMLDRCYLVSRYKLAGNREFILINTHNSAYDDGSLRKAQLQQLAGFAGEEYRKGNAVIIGGDWNQCPTGFIPGYTHAFDTANLSYLPSDFLPDWQQVYCDSLPSNRRIVTPYQFPSTPTTVIDFYIVSPNIETIGVQTVDMDFQYSDHQPVFLTFRIKH